MLFIIPSGILLQMNGPKSGVSSSFCPSRLQPQKLTQDTQSCDSFVLLFVGQGDVLRKYSSPVNVQRVSSSSSSASTSTTSVFDSFVDDSGVKLTVDNTIEEDVFTLAEEKINLDLPPSTRVCLYKVERTFLDDPARRADLARALPSMHAVVFVCSAEDKRNRFDAVAQYEGRWLLFVNEHANRHMLRAFVVPPSTASAPGWDVHVKPSVTSKNVQMHVKNVSNSDDVRAFSLGLLQSTRSCLTETERTLFLSPLRLSASSDLPSTSGTRTLLSFSEASQVANTHITLMDVLPQMQAGSDATKLHPQTPFTAYVTNYALIMNTRFAAFVDINRLLSCTHPLSV